MPRSKRLGDHGSLISAAALLVCWFGCDALADRMLLTFEGIQTIVPDGDAWCSARGGRPAPTCPMDKRRIHASSVAFKATCRRPRERVAGLLQRASIGPLDRVDIPRPSLMEPVLTRVEWKG